MSPLVLLSFVFGYFLLLLGVAWVTSRNSDNESFFIGNRNSNWMLVAFGMIGTSLSGVTFVSVPGLVGSSGFNYFQVVIGYIFGYMIIAFVLIPLYYRMNLTSIYTYLERRLGISAHKAGAFFFILSRIVGATARLYLVISVLQTFIFNTIEIPFLHTVGIPFWVTGLVILVLILLYTFEGGVKTIIYTDTLQTTGMLVGLVVFVIFIIKALNMDFGSALAAMESKGYTRIFNWDFKSGGYAFKHILGGMFIAIAMTGLDQEMMQKNISVKTLKDSQKNIMTFTVVMTIVNFLFLFLGGVLYLYASSAGITNVPADDLFPTIALSGAFGQGLSIIFVIALISALFPSVDGAITSLTSCYCIDILGLNKQAKTERQKKRTRLIVHFSFAVIFFIMLLIFKAINDKSIIDFILKFAGVTYGPLLGLFAFGILTRRTLNQRMIWTVCIIAPLIALGADMLSNPVWYEQKLHTTLGLTPLSQSVFHGYQIGNELILINGLLTFIGLLLISRRTTQEPVLVAD